MPDLIRSVVDYKSIHPEEEYIYYAENGTIDHVESSSNIPPRSYASSSSSSSSSSHGSSSSSIYRTLALIGFLGVTGIMLFGNSYTLNEFSSTSVYHFLGTGNFDTITTSIDTSVSENSGGLSATVTNEYSSRGNVIFDYPFLRGALLMEPYRTSKITMGGHTAGCDLSWSLASATQGKVIVSGVDIDNDGVFEITPNARPGEYLLTVDEKCTNGGLSTKTLSQTVWIKYVRRELMSLTDEDREEFLDAFRTVWDVSTVDGIAKYGENYKSVYYFAMIHNDAGANAICDEFHSGAGFLNNHIYIGLYLEQSMRLVNPRVSLHYMEYTKYFSGPEFLPHIENQMDGGKWSEFLSEKWFGSNDPLSGAIVDSRWKDTVVPRVDKDFMARENIKGNIQIEYILSTYPTFEPFTTHSEIYRMELTYVLYTSTPHRTTHDVKLIVCHFLIIYHPFLSGGSTFFPDEGENWMRKTGPHISSPYGLVRAPWNYNPSPYLTRYNNLNRLSTTDVTEHVMKPYIGSNCEDMKRFINDYTVGKPMETYLESAEDIVHGYIHFTFGGMGGPLAAQIDEVLQKKYGMSNMHMFYIAESAHKFVKTYLSGLDLDGNVPPMNCTINPWNPQLEVLKTEAAPGEKVGPMCTCNSYYFESEENLNSLIDLYFNHFMPDDDSLKNVDFATRKEIMMLVCSRMSYEGDPRNKYTLFQHIFPPSFTNILSYPFELISLPNPSHPLSLYVP